MATVVQLRWMQATRKLLYVNNGELRHNASQVFA
jgi:hypothetical protein